MADDGTILIGSADDGPVSFDLRFANRHGLIAGATGTGKSMTLQLLAANFAHGVPLFLANVKGDLSGLAAAAAPSKKIDERARASASTRSPAGFAGRLLDVIRPGSDPVRASISSIGPLLLARPLGPDTQQSVLPLVFKSPTTRACSCWTSPTCG